jgi:hypothetical protein
MLQSQNLIEPHAGLPFSTVSRLICCGRFLHLQMAMDTTESPFQNSPCGDGRAAFTGGGNA